MDRGTTILLFLLGNVWKINRRSWRHWGKRIKIPEEISRGGNQSTVGGLALAWEGWDDICFVCSGCYEKVPQTMVLLFLTGLEAGSLRPACQHGWVRAVFHVADFSYPHMAEGASGLCGVSFVRTLIPSPEFCPHWHSYLQYHHLLIRSDQGLGFQHINLGGTKHSVYSHISSPEIGKKEERMQDAGCSPPPALWRSWIYLLRMNGMSNTGEGLSPTGFGSFYIPGLQVIGVYWKYTQGRKQYYY